MMQSDEMVVMGRVSGVFGVCGWFKVYSDTKPREGILQYSQWYLQQHGEWREVKLLEGKRQGKGVIAKIQGCDDRDQAAALQDSKIAIRRAQLPALEAGEYYWTDLEGLRVETLGGVELGRVSYLFETGANDVVVVKGERERMIPYTWGEAIRRVDLAAGLMLVDWDPEF